jgi:carbohydrate-selective porin OprB
VVEWIMPRAALRLGSFMEPKSANQLQLDGDVRRAHGDTAELELDYALGDAAGITRILAFDNHAHMGSYAATLADPALQNDIAATRVYRSKYGCALNCEQALTGWAGAFLRAGWNDGHSETWAFTEIDQSLACGVSIQGTPWGRPDDVLGLAGLVNGLSQEHRAYLAAGGYGFIIGDGRLTYAPEDIIEAYASVRVCPAVTVSLDYQYVTNPAYNHDRGPVSIIGVRGHIEL